MNNQEKLNQDLIEACERGDLKEAKKLIKQGADINAKDEDGWTSLMMACLFGHQDIVKLLIEKGTDINATSNFGYTALMKACEYGHQEIAELLLEQEADINAKDRHGWTALALACKCGHLEIAKLFLKADASKNFIYRESLGEDKRTVFVIKEDNKIRVDCFTGDYQETKQAIVEKYGENSEYEQAIDNMFNKLNKVK